MGKTRAKPEATATDRRPKALRQFMPEEGLHPCPVFSFARMDVNYSGEWGWGMLDQPKAKLLLDFFHEMSKLTWTQVLAQRHGKHPRHHLHEASSLCSDAQKRLEQLEWDDIPELFRFTLGGKERLWGHKHDGMFYVLWWDPNHRVYPMD